VSAFADGFRPQTSSPAFIAANTSTSRRGDIHVCRKHLSQYAIDNQDGDGSISIVPPSKGAFLQACSITRRLDRLR
jgi:hypothetical protein